MMDGMNNGWGMGYGWVIGLIVNKPNQCLFILATFRISDMTI